MDIAIFSPSSLFFEEEDDDTLTSGTSLSLSLSLYVRFLFLPLTISVSQCSWGKRREPRNLCWEEASVSWNGKPSIFNNIFNFYFIIIFIIWVLFWGAQFQGFSFIACCGTLFRPLGYTLLELSLEFSCLLFMLVLHTLRVLFIEEKWDCDYSFKSW